MKTNKINFKINYKKLTIFNEFNTQEIKFPLILSSPHSGTVFPEEFLKAINKEAKDLRINEDSFVDELLKKPIESGIPTLTMNIARAFVDVNRDKTEIDPSMYFDFPEEDENQCSRRCRVGLGVIHRITEPNKEIYDGQISYTEANERIKHVYDAYHKRLQQIISKIIRKFGFCFILDCHSMPSKICSSQLLNDKPIDFCIGNLFDQSCPSEMSAFLMEKLTNAGYNAVYNCPYSGAFITFNYCQPRKKVFTLQLETNRALYMKESVYKKTASFQKISDVLGGSIESFSKFLLDFKF